MKGRMKEVYWSGKNYWNYERNNERGGLVGGKNNRSMKGKMKEGSREVKG